MKNGINMTNQSRIDFVKSQYPMENSQYDLATNLLFDNVTDNLSDLKMLCTGYFGEIDEQVIEAAFEDFNS